MRTSLLLIGILALVIGAIWVGQGTGLFLYPASSFMLHQLQWAYYGGGLALVGLLLIGLSRRA